MKKLGLLLIALVFSLSSTVYAGTVLLSGATATGAGTPMACKQCKSHTIVVTFVNTSTLVISLDGSVDNTTWPSIGAYTIDATDISNGYAILHINDRLVDYVRPNITTLTGGGAAVTATVSSAK